MSEKKQFVPLGEEQEDEEAMANETTEEKVCRLLNQAQLEGKDKKLECLNQVKELILNKEPSLLDNFFEEVVAFQQDSALDVRKFVVGFMEDACKKDHNLLTQAIPILRYIMGDSNVNVQKRVITCFIPLYRLAVTYLCQLKTFEDPVKDMWEVMKDAKADICQNVVSENDGIRTLVIKFMEMVILTQTKKEAGSEPLRGNELDVSLDMIPSSHPLLKLSELREEAGMILGNVLELSASPDISSVNLMTCVSTLSAVARQRPMHFPTVVQSFELLQANMSPYFSSSQANSVNKHLKREVLGLLRQPASYECRAQIVNLLTALGCTQSEIAKNTPKPEKKRGREVDSGPAAKKIRTAGGDDRQGKTEDGDPVGVPGSAFLEAIEMTATDLKPLLTPDMVTELVVLNMKNLPRFVPKSFQHTYTPIAAAGNDAQINHLAHLLASQMTTAGIGVGAITKNINPPSRLTSPVVSDPRRRRRQSRDSPAREGRSSREREEEQVKQEEPAEVKTEQKDLAESMVELAYLGSLLGLPDVLDPVFPLAYTAFFGDLPPGSKIEEENEEVALDPEAAVAVHSDNLVEIQTMDVSEPEDRKQDGSKRPVSIVSGPQRLKKIQQFDLAGMVRPVSPTQQMHMSVAAFKRILGAETGAVQGGATKARTQIIISLVTQFGGELNDALLEFILSDLRGHFDLAVAWLFAEYCVEEGYVTTAQNTLHYDSCLTGLLHGAREKLDNRDRLFSRLVLEAPRITTSALAIIKSYCKEEERAFLGLSTLRDLIIRKPQGTDEFLLALLEVTLSDMELARAQSLHIAKKLYGRSDLASRVERFAVQALQNLLADHPEQQLVTDLEVTTEWTEDSVKTFSGLFLALLPLNHNLLKELAIVYTNTVPAVKRIILKLLDQPVRTIGMSSPELLQLVEDCPPGAETLIMRMLYILTENAAPSPELVRRVRELYQRNSSDVRFLIPVLHGLQKHEVIAALPKFIRLSPHVMKGVFEKLLISYKGEHSHSMSPVAPSELLIALHNIDCKSNEAMMKAVIRATNLCFADKTVYTQEVLAVVLQQLLEQTPVPMLFMRTVIQSLGVCPRLVNFVMTILVKLLSKQVWKQPKVWQGFIKCCEVTKPHSFQVMLQLPPRQLESILEASPTLKAAFVSHVQGFTPSQRACVSRVVLQVIEKESSLGEEMRKSGKRSRRESVAKRKKSKTPDQDENQSVKQTTPAT